MPKYGPHLPDIEKKVREKVAELRLAPSYLFDCRQHKERFYTARCHSQEDRDVIFKMRTEDFWETQEAFRREIRINRLFTEFYKNDRTLSVPRFVIGDSECVPEWMVYEFIPGEEAGDFYNGILPENFGKLSLTSLIEGMRSMQAMSAFAAGKVRLEAYGYGEFRQAYERYCPVLRPFLSDAAVTEGSGILRDGANFLDKKSGVIAHGDFHPGNLVISPEGEVAIIDWYYVQMNNAAFDIAFLYLEIADDDFRRELLERYIAEMVDDGKEFYELFRLDILRIVPQKVSVLRDALCTDEPAKDDYYEKLTVQGAAKLAKNLEAFERALEGSTFY